ncbi:hypothetical protein BDZ89DRAFT_1058224 [Hymenopellis radicata]|nr:hypothetical protein BDZ89DRAFT_1058224 [Hymenopellis radicata]
MSVLSGLIAPHLAPTHYHPPDLYDSNSSDSDSSSDEESDVDDEEAAGDDAKFVENDEESLLKEKKNLKEDDDDDDYEMVPIEDLEEDSLALTGEGLNAEDSDDTVEENEAEMDDFLFMALDEENKNECPLEERDFEATLPSKPVALKDIPPLPTFVEDQVMQQPSLPAPDPLPIPKPTNRSPPRKSKGKKKLEASEKPSVNETQDADYREWEKSRRAVKMGYYLPCLEKPKPPTPDGKPLPSRKKRARALSETNQSQPAEQDQVRTPKRARLDQEGKASPAAKADSPNPPGLVGGPAPTGPSFRQLWDEADKSRDYKPFAVPNTTKADYYTRLHAKYPHLKGERFFGKERRLPDGTVIECPVIGCGASLTVGKLIEHVRCHKDSEGKLTCISKKVHTAARSFSTEKAMAKHIVKDHVNHYLCPHCGIEMRPEMNKYVKHLQICPELS